MSSTKRVRVRWVVLAYFVVAQVYVWVQFLSLTTGESPTPPEIILPAVAEIVAALLVAGWVIVANRSLPWVIASTVNAVVLLVAQFSVWYVSYGSAKNWHPALTPLDGLALTLGTLTTAGAPGITPHSELARSLITIQLGVDILAAIVLFGLFVARISSRLAARPAAPGGLPSET
jgi:hypothetical protein